METVQSIDGTAIACEKCGQGAPLFLVHGTSADHTRWAPVLQSLQERFTVYAVDRRGRGGSGDTEPYAIEREFEDIVAVVNSIGGPVIFYSRNGGATVRPLMLGVTGNSTSIDAANLGGSNQALFRVVATDGVNTAQADSAVFEMANKPPRPMILAPSDNTHIHYGQLVNFSGEALDDQGGSVSDANLVWTNQAGPLGTGSLLSVSSLPVGVNVITLTATDSVGLSAKTSITVVVDDDLNLPGPALSAGLSQLSWSFTSNAAPSQAERLKLSNAGGGTLTWDVRTDASWLKLSAIHGTAPFTLTLTADPAGVGNDTAHSGHVIFTVPPGGGQLTQTLTIPVNIAVGGSASNPPFWSTHVYLPIIFR